MIMKNLIQFIFKISILISFIVSSGCKKDNFTSPVIKTLSPENITSSSATSGISILDNGGSELTSSGVCWSTSVNPTLSDFRSEDGGEIGKFVSTLKGLTPLTTYYVRSYATSEAGTFYGTEYSFSTSSADLTVSDIDGNIYGIITIGSQIWMKENLKTTRYSNGDLIGTLPAAAIDIYNEPSPKYQWAYSGNEGFAERYGRLYTWYAATDNRNVCPTGWHLPSDPEWKTLTDYLINSGYGSEGVENHLGQTLAANSDWAPYGVPGSAGNDLIANNSSGFSALPAGFLNPMGRFQSIMEVTYYWSSTESKEGANFALQRKIYYPESGFYTDEWGGKTSAVSVRCVKN